MMLRDVVWKKWDSNWNYCTYSHEGQCVTIFHAQKETAERSYGPYCMYHSSTPIEPNKLFPQNTTYRAKLDSLEVQCLLADVKQI